MKLYTEMLNIERASDRKQLMLEELERKNIQAQFFNAVDFKKNSKEEILSECQAYGPWGQFHIQNMAATLSHARAWERFLQSDAEICMIMEDDIYISDDLEAWLSDLSWWPEDADIVKLECWIEKLSKKGPILLENPGKRHLGRKVKKLLTRHMGAAGYLLTRKSAEKLLKSKPFNMVIDQMLFNLNASKVAKNLNIYQIIPALIIQGNEPSKRIVYMEQRANASGAALLKQEIKRGLYEISVPIKTFLKLLFRKAAFEKISYKDKIDNK